MPAADRFSRSADSASGEHPPASPSDELIRSFVHVARNELAGASGLSEMLADPDLTDLRRADLQHQIGHLVARWVPLLDGLSDMNELEQGRYTPIAEPIDLQHLVGTAADMLQADWPNRLFAVSFAPGLPAARADEIYTSRIVDTLLRNAANYASGDIFVRLTMDTATARVGVTVGDEGPAWPADWRELVFARLAKLPPVRPRWPRHTLQLGLYVARQLAHRMGGDLQLEPNARGGNEFKLSLPTEPSAS